MYHFYSLTKHHNFRVGICMYSRKLRRLKYREQIQIKTTTPTSFDRTEMFIREDYIDWSEGEKLKASSGLACGSCLVIFCCSYLCSGVNSSLRPAHLLFIFENTSCSNGVSFLRPAKTSTISAGHAADIG